MSIFFLRDQSDDADRAILWTSNLLILLNTFKCVITYLKVFVIKTQTLNNMVTTVTSNFPNRL